MAKRLREVKILEASDWTTDRYKKREKKMNQDTDTLQEKNTAIAIALSVLWTGAGHLYVGKENKGLFCSSSISDSRDLSIPSSFPSLRKSVYRNLGNGVALSREQPFHSR